MADDRKVVFVSYWTSKYKKSAERLKRSLDRLKLESDINEIPDKGFLANVRHKPTYILEMLKKHSEAYAVVWIDADGDVVKMPAVFWETEEDLAVRFKPIVHKNCEELLSGTMFVRRTERMLKAMEQWIEKLAAAPQTLLCPEQQVLHQILNTLDISVKKLDEPYCRILKDRGRHGVPEDSVIVHYQFSRETRHGRQPAPHLYEDTKVGGLRSLPPKVYLRDREPVRTKERPRKIVKSRPARKQMPEQVRIPDSLKAALRRNKIKALRQHVLAKERAAEAAQAAIRMAMGARNRYEKLEREHNKLYPRNRDLYVGGVRGHPPTPRQLALAKVMMGGMRQASELPRLFEGKTVIVMGNSPSIDLIPPEVYRKYWTVGCNRAMRSKVFHPHVLVIGDREPYCQERDSGRLDQAVSEGVKLVFADSIFDPSILLRGPYSDMNRRAQPCPSFDVYLYRIGPRRKTWDYSDIARGVARLPVNFDSFEAPVVSCLNVAGSMLQVAGILGAKRIVCIGIEMKWDSVERSHFFGCGARVGAYPQDGSIEVIMAALRIVRDRAEKRGIEIINVSPHHHVPFAKDFGNYGLERFLEESEALPALETPCPTNAP